MPPRRRIVIAQRRRIFVGCEGESERSYVRLLKEFCDAAGLPVYLDAQIIQPAGGNPDIILEKAVVLLSRLEKAGDRYEAKYILLDTDVAVSRNGDAHLDTLSQRASREGMVLVWQRTCHEALLLRHLQGCERLRPPTLRDALRELERRIEGYRKGWPASRLAEHIDAGGVRRAATAEPELRLLLKEIGLIP